MTYTNVAFAFYDAAIDYLEMSMKEGHDPADVEKVRKAYINAWREARFLFGKDSHIYTLIGEMQNHVIVAMTPIDSATVLYSPLVHKEHMQRRQAAIDWLMKAGGQLSEAIEPFIGFQKLQKDWLDDEGL